MQVFGAFVFFFFFFLSRSSGISKYKTNIHFSLDGTLTIKKSSKNINFVKFEILK